MMVDTMKLYICFHLLAFAYTTASNHTNLIKQLPGLDIMPNFNMFSGYLNAGVGKRMFYWLNEIQATGGSKTLLIWLNGGPGCSSLYGLFRENGPFLYNATTGQLVENKFSWNRFAHTLYLEAPIGTGYSYTTKEDAYVTTDYNTAEDLMLALDDFLQVVHPEYNGFDVYLSGESYAGIYIPTLAVKIMKRGGKLAKHFKGIALGNPTVRNRFNEISLAHYAYFHGFIGDKLFDEIKSHNCYNVDDIRNEDDECRILRETVKTEVSASVNMFDYGRTCWKKRNQQKPEIDFYDLLEGNVDESEFEEYINGGGDAGGGPDRSRIANDFCEDVTSFENFLRQPEMLSSIHADVRNWRLCRRAITTNHRKELTDMSSRILKLVNEYQKKVLMYYGDQDLTCNFIGGQDFVYSLGLKKTEQRNPFFIRTDGRSHVAWFTEEFANRLTFVIIKDAGHMAPADKPQETSTLVRTWIASSN